MKTHKNKVGRKTRECLREEYVSKLKKRIWTLGREIATIKVRRWEEKQYTIELQKFIGRKKLREFKELKEDALHESKDDNNVKEVAGC